MAICWYNVPEQDCLAPVNCENCQPCVENNAIELPRRPVKINKTELTENGGYSQRFSVSLPCYYFIMCGVDRDQPPCGSLNGNDLYPCYNAEAFGDPVNAPVYFADLQSPCSQS